MQNHWLRNWWVGSAICFNKPSRRLGCTEFEMCCVSPCCPYSRRRSSFPSCLQVISTKWTWAAQTSQATHSHAGLRSEKCCARCHGDTKKCELPACKAYSLIIKTRQACAQSYPTALTTPWVKASVFRGLGSNRAHTIPGPDCYEWDFNEVT